MKLDRVGLVVCASLSLSLFAGCGADAPDPSDNVSTDPIVRGKNEKKLPQVVLVRINLYSGSVVCSGTYFSSRVVVTAAHCLNHAGIIPGQTFVYFGKDYLTDVASLPIIPAPGPCTPITTRASTFPTSRCCTWTASCRSIRSRCCARR
jgi:hypothetical protein